jgi:hypothetical protein
MWHTWETGEVHKGFWSGDLRKRDHLEDNIKMDVEEVGWWERNWNDLAQKRDGWWAVVNEIMNLWVS